MKRLSFLILALLFLVSVQTANGESPRKKYSKIVRKEAKRLAKEGWIVEKNAPSLEEQVEKLHQAYLELDDNLSPKYVISEGSSAAATPQGAILVALANAKESIALQLYHRMVEDGYIVLQETVTYTEIGDPALNEVQEPTVSVSFKHLETKKIMVLTRKCDNVYEALVVIACDYMNAVSQNIDKD